MKFLGRGWQYTTYDLGNGRVLKRYNSIPVGYLRMFKECFPFRDVPIWKLPSFYRGCKETAFDSLKKVQETTLEPWMMGNPKVLNDYDYEQDKLVPLHDYFVTADVHARKGTIDRFVDFNKLLVTKSLIDKSFNITQNFGLDSHARIVLMDLGELYSSPSSITRQIQNRAWSKQYITKHLPEVLREYFVTKMDVAFGVMSRDSTTRH